MEWENGKGKGIIYHYALKILINSNYSLTFTKENKTANSFPLLNNIATINRII